MLATLSMAIPLTVMADQAVTQKHGNPPPRPPLTLMEKVQQGIAKNFKDPKDALRNGWINATACVSGPNEGAMGIHLVNNRDPEPMKPPLVIRDGDLNPAEPEALIYEPVGGGYFRLVGVEFIQLADDWAARVAKDSSLPGTPRVNGQLMNLVGTPNRYGLPAFYELHVWAFADNPRGNFADWNTLVNCNRAKPEDLPNPQ
jgi:hypothetical protein